MERWPHWLRRYTMEGEPSLEYHFQARREAMLTLLVERKVAEEPAINLLYGEARKQFLAGRYIRANRDDDLAQAVSLAALHLQITYGDASAATGKPGFITNGLAELVPTYMHRYWQGAEWETRVREAHAALKGKSGLIAHLLYLQRVRACPQYGATWFPACASPPPGMKFEDRSEHWIVGVTATGVSVIDLDRSVRARAVFV